MAPVLQYGLYALLGVVVGTFGGLFGVGGGIICVPALVLLAKFSQQEAQGISLAMMVPTALANAYWYYQGKTTKPAYLLIAVAIALGAVLTAKFGSGLAQRMNPNLLQTFFALFLMVVAAQMILKTSAGPARHLAGMLTVPGGLLLVGVGLWMIFAKQGGA